MISITSALLALGTAACAADGPEDRTGESTQALSGQSGDHAKPRHRGHSPERMIERFDENKDGTLQISELPERKREKLGAADTDNDGALSAVEIAGYFAAKHQRKFQRKDENGDGFLTEEELGQRRWSKYKQADTDEDGKLTPDEMATAFKAGTLKAGHCGGHRKFSKSPEKFLEKFDVDGNGSVELGELPDHKQHKMTKMDADGDGSITRDELAAAFEERARRRFSKHDENEDGVLTVDEVGERKFAFLSVADENADGKLTFDEIASAKKAGKLFRGRGRHGHDGKRHD